VYPEPISIQVWQTDFTWADPNAKTDVVKIASQDPTPYDAGIPRLFTNDTQAPKTFNVETGVYNDIDGQPVSGDMILGPFTSRILIYTGQEPTFAEHDFLSNAKERITISSLPGNLYRLDYFLEKHAHVNLRIYNSRGQLIHTLVNSPHLPGRYITVWDRTTFQGGPAAPGIYYLRMKLSRKGEEPKAVIKILSQL
jgi:hypothetical protein